jgi:hypothetical protein
LLCKLNPDFAVGFVMRSSKTIQKRVSGYFLSEEIVIYFELKKWPVPSIGILKACCVKRFSSAIELQLQNLG